VKRRLKKGVVNGSFGSFSGIERGKEDSHHEHRNAGVSHTSVTPTRVFGGLPIFDCCESRSLLHLPTCLFLLIDIYVFSSPASLGAFLNAHARRTTAPSDSSKA
jgi:hypothetical protein